MKIPSGQRRFSCVNAQCYLSLYPGKVVYTRRFSILPLLLMLVMSFFVLVSAVTSQGNSGEASPSVMKGLPKEKETTPGLYLTSKEAYTIWNADQLNIKILDVRTPEEYIFIGHADMAWNIPLAFQTYEWDTEKKQFKMKPNPEFLHQVKSIAGPQDTLLVMCRSGGRSALAVNQLAADGYYHVYNITDGMEGDLVSDPESVYAGQRMKNGWKNSGLPWTYKLNPERMLFSKK